MEKLVLPVKQLTQSFSLMADTLKTVNEKFKDLAALLIIMNNKNFRKHNDPVNMVARLLKNKGRM